MTKPRYIRPRKLNANKAREMRRRFFIERTPRKQLAQEYGCCLSHVSRVLSGYHW